MLTCYTSGVVIKQKKHTTRQKLAHHAKKLLVPHKANNYHPHLIRWRGLAVVLAVVVIVQFGYTTLAKGSFDVLGDASTIAVSELLDGTNAARKEAGLQPLTLNKKLTQAALLKGQDMLANNYWAHTSPSGVTPWKWYTDVDYQYDVAGENLAKNYPSAAATVAAWMASPAHRENILRKEFKEVGFSVLDGTIDGEKTTLVVAEYGSPILVTPLAPATHAASIGDNDLPLLTYIGVLVQSMNPATIGIVLLLAFVATIAGITHHFRSRLPKAWRKSWRSHHGLYKMVGILLVMVLVIAGSTGGQI